MCGLFVFFDRQLGSVAEWQQAIDKEGFAIRLSTSDLSDEMSGHVPARLGYDDAGFACDQADSTTLMARYPDVDFRHAWRCVRAFRSGPDLKSNVASWIGAVIFAKITGGKVFDPRDRKLYAPEEVLSSLREIERDILQVEDELKKLKEQPRKASAITGRDHRKAVEGRRRRRRRSSTSSFFRHVDLAAQRAEFGAHLGHALFLRLLYRFAT
jgi:hypothetical protein